MRQHMALDRDYAIRSCFEMRALLQWHSCTAGLSMDRSRIGSGLSLFLAAAGLRFCVELDRIRTNCQKYSLPFYILTSCIYYALH